MTNPTTFELNGTTYEMRANGYCYASYEQSESGKTHRISKAEFEAAQKQYAMMDMTIDQIEGAVLDTKESLVTEEVLEAVADAQAQEKPKKSNRRRIPKSVGHRKTYGDIEVILTEKQVDFIRHLPDTCYWENGLDSAIWVDCLCDEIEGQFANKPMTVGAMISTICEKGLGKRGRDKINGRKCTSFALTELGKMVAKDLGL